MLASLFTLALTLLPTLIVGAAIPQDDTRAVAEPADLQKRAQSTLYLANCDRASGQVGYQASYGVWYNDNSKSWGGAPDALTNEYRDWANNGSYLQWMGGSGQTIYFPGSSTTVWTHINDLRNSNTYASEYAGDAWRSTDMYHFSCYVDTGRELFYLPANQAPGGHWDLRCRAQFYCV